LVTRSNQGAFEIQLEDLIVWLAVVLGVYGWVLLIVIRQTHVYMDLLSQLLPRLGRRPGERRGTRREDAVSAANRKKRYREALD
jgi:hypothetical protein